MSTTTVWPAATGASSERPVTGGATVGTPFDDWHPVTTRTVATRRLYGYYCQLCGYQWLQRPGEILPVNNNPAARAFGQAKLDEEERARQAAAAAYWYNQK